MNYEKISPLGQREGLGTFDTVYNEVKYPDKEKAFEEKECVVIDFVKGEDGIIYFEFYHMKEPKIKKHHRLDIQYFPVGIDMFDDQNAMEIGMSMLAEYEKR